MVVGVSVERSAFPYRPLKLAPAVPAYYSDQGQKQSRSRRWVSSSLVARVQRDNCYEKDRATQWKVQFPKGTEILLQKGLPLSSINLSGRAVALRIR